MCHILPEFGTRFLHRNVSYEYFHLFILCILRPSLFICIKIFDISCTLRGAGGPCSFWQQGLPPICPMGKSALCSGDSEWMNLLICPRRSSRIECWISPMGGSRRTPFLECAPVSFKGSALQVPERTECISRCLPSCEMGSTSTHSQLHTPFYTVSVFVLFPGMCSSCWAQVIS